MNAPEPELAIHGALIKAIRPVALVVSPVVLLIAFIGNGGRLTGAFALLAGAAAVIIVAVSLDSVGPLAQARAIAAAVVLTSITVTLTFGPNSGAGLFMAMSSLAATLVLKRRWAWLVVLVLPATVAVYQAGRMPPLEVVRLTATTAMMLLTFHLVFVATLRAHQRTAAAALRAELAAHEATVREQGLRQVEDSRQRMEALGRLAGGVAHDFNNALSVILAGVSALRSTDDERERAEILSEIQQGATRAAATSRQLLSLGKGGEDGPGRCRPGELLGPFVRALDRIMPDNLTVQLQGPLPSEEVAMSRGALEQVLLNLVLNARDAMPGGGTMTVGAQTVDGHVRVFVRDAGTGMSDEVKARVFEPFFSTKGDAGTGLGLPMVKAMVERCGGTVRLDSVPGAGTTVSLTFPVTAAGDGPVIEVAAPAVLTGERRALVVEDAPLVRRAVERGLSSAGFTVTAVGTQAEAVGLVRSQHYDVLVSDAMLTDGNAQPLIDVFRRRAPSAPVILCSGSLDDAALEALGGAHVHRLHKPVSSERLVALAVELTQRPAPPAQSRTGSRPLVFLSPL